MTTSQSKTLSIAVFNIGMLLLLLLLLRSLIIVAVDCESGRGECITPSNCEPLKIASSIARFKFCDQPRGTICCPKKKNTSLIITEDISLPAVRACKEYREQVYKDCGVEPFIYDGIEAKPRELPHMALIGEKQSNGAFNGHCGGTLVTPRFVLTAAHCFESETTHVRLGELDYSTDTDDARPVDIAIKKILYPPTYDEFAKYNDIALIELQTAAVLSEYVVPACMTQTDGDKYNHFIAAGWGYTEKLKFSPKLLKVYLERFDYNECYTRYDIGGELNRGVFDRTQICAGSRHNRSDTCSGDSGGPLFRQHERYPCMYEVVGITSFGSICGNKSRNDTIPIPGVYTRVGRYKDWIEQIIWDAAKHD